MSQTITPPFGAKKFGDFVEIIIDDKGTTVPAKFIGAGKYTAAYLTYKYVYQYVFRNDESKQIIADCIKRYPGTRYHLPNIKYLADIQYSGSKRVGRLYRTKFFRRVRKSMLTPYQIRLVDALQDAHDGACVHYPHNVAQTSECGNFNRFIATYPSIPPTMRGTLMCLADCAADYENYIFDNFKPRNLGIGSQGQIVLLDPLFRYDYE